MTREAELELRIDKPAMVGQGRFGKGVLWRTVIEAAQRRYEQEVTPESETKRLEKAAEINIVVAVRDAQIEQLKVDKAELELEIARLREALDAVKQVANRSPNTTTGMGLGLCYRVS